MYIKLDMFLLVVLTRVQQKKFRWQRGLPTIRCDFLHGWQKTARAMFVFAFII